MVSLKLQKRLAASELSCGQRKVWLDPNEVTDISMANSSTSMNHLLCYFIGCYMNYGANDSRRVHAASHEPTDPLGNGGLCH